MSEESEIRNLFLNTKPVELLLQLNKPNARHYASALSKDVGVTYSHTVKCIQQFKEFELVEFEKKGRKKEIDLTDTGENLAIKFESLEESVEGDSSEVDTLSDTDIF